MNKTTPKKKTKTIYIVIRTGSLDNEDAMEELQKVIDEHGYSWFGKYGQPLNKNLTEVVKSGKMKIVVVLVQKDLNSESGYKTGRYKLLEVATTIPKDGAYPIYYKGVLSRMGSWLKLAKHSGRKIILSDLYVKSSMNSLLNSLRHSMRGHFICHSRRGD